ncbi:hypothetical protein AB0M92_00175 [Streptomyces sp. NPDC051582]|uniref:hypothetical protein n=1 Tax=Streptomyces sp. NPDC051582 TaxID=3155167 RepID=UPI003439F46A
MAWGDARTGVDALSDLGLWLGELAVFDATVAAVPFLWDLATADSVNSRAAVIELLRAILEHDNPPQIEVQLAAHCAVLTGRSIVGALATGSDPAARAAAHALGQRSTAIPARPAVQPDGGRMDTPFGRSAPDGRRTPAMRSA